MKFLLTILLIYISYRIFRSFFIPRKDAPRHRGERKEPTSHGGDAPRHGGDDPRHHGEETVFDEVCKTYITKDSALKATFGGCPPSWGNETRYFCSDECMRKFRDTMNGPY